MKSMEENKKFDEGNVVWAKFDEFPHWPCRIAKHEDTLKFREYYNREDGTAVLFFGNPLEWALVEDYNIVASFEENISNYDHEDSNLKIAIEQARNSSTIEDPTIDLTKRKRRRASVRRKSLSESAGKKRRRSSVRGKSTSMSESQEIKQNTDQNNSQTYDDVDNQQITENSKNQKQKLGNSENEEIDDVEHKQAEVIGESIQLEEKGQEDKQEVILENEQNKINNEALVDSENKDSNYNISIPTEKAQDDNQMLADNDNVIKNNSNDVSDNKQAQMAQEASVHAEIKNLYNIDTNQQEHVPENTEAFNKNNAVEVLETSNQILEKSNEILNPHVEKAPLETNIDGKKSNINEIKGTFTSINKIDAAYKEEKHPVHDTSDNNKNKHQTDAISTQEDTKAKSVDIIDEEQAVQDLNDVNKNEVIPDSNPVQNDNIALEPIDNTGVCCNKVKEIHQDIQQVADSAIQYVKEKAEENEQKFHNFIERDGNTLIDQKGPNGESAVGVLKNAENKVAFAINNVVETYNDAYQDEKQESEKRNDNINNEDKVNAHNDSKSGSSGEEKVEQSNQTTNKTEKLEKENGYNKIEKGKEGDLNYK